MDMNRQPAVILLVDPGFDAADIKAWISVNALLCGYGS
jgi:hypothetical protein